LIAASLAELLAKLLADGRGGITHLFGRPQQLFFANAEMPRQIFQLIRVAGYDAASIWREFSYGWHETFGYSGRCVLPKSQPSASAMATAVYGLSSMVWRTMSSNEDAVFRTLSAALLAASLACPYKFSAVP
jgi:hypothetical protein